MILCRRPRAQVERTLPQSVSAHFPSRPAKLQAPHIPIYPPARFEKPFGQDPRLYENQRWSHGNTSPNILFQGRKRCRVSCFTKCLQPWGKIANGTAQLTISNKKIGGDEHNPVFPSLRPTGVPTPVSSQLPHRASGLDVRSRLPPQLQPVQCTRRFAPSRSHSLQDFSAGQPS